MAVKIKKDILREFLKKSLFETEHVKYGMFDKPGPHEKEAGEINTTVPSQVPIKPAELMSNQLVDERPPVEDDSYVPANTEEFSRAVKALAAGVSTDDIEKAYLEFKRMVNEIPPPEKEVEEPLIMPITRTESLKRAIELILREGRWGEEDPRFMHDEEPEMEDELPEPVSTEPEGSGLDQLASEFGYAGASGVRQDIERMLQRMRYMSEKLDKGEMAKLQDFAVGEFIDLMKDGEYIDDEDAVEFQQNPTTVKQLDSFRFFFVSAIMMPAYNEIKRIARKKVELLISKLKLPSEMNQSILNQALGEVPLDLDKLEKKLRKVSDDAGVIDPSEVDQMVIRLKSGFSELRKASETSGGLGEMAERRWEKQSPGRKQQALAQALQSTMDWKGAGDTGENA